MNGDIVDRIRGLRYVHVPVASHLFDEACQEIERLRAELRYERARADLHDHAEELVELRRLVAGLREIDEG
jgi:hypothetical protein